MAKRDKFKGILNQAIKQKGDSEAQIKAKIHIEDEFRDLIPPLREDEYAQLAQNIADEGCREPLVVWKVPQDTDDELAGKYVLIDGHNRHRICTTYQVDFKIHMVQFQTRHEARSWIINNQLGRRNLTKEQQAHLRGTRYNTEKAQGQRTDLGNDDKAKSKESTAKRIAKEYNVDEKTIRRDAKFAKGMEIIGNSNPELKQDILKGKVKVNKGDVQKLGEVAKDSAEIPVLAVEDIRKRAIEIEEGKKEQATQPIKTTQYTDEQVQAQIEHYHASINKALEVAIKNRDKLALSKIKADINHLEKLLFNN